MPVQSNLHPFVSYAFPVFSDYAGKTSVIVYVGGCKLDCPYCFSRHIVNCKTSIDINDVIKACSNKFINGLVISGGEPLLHQNHVISLIKTVKQTCDDISVKIDSSLTEEIDDNLLCLLDGVNVGLKPSVWLSDSNKTALKHNIHKTINIRDLEVRVTLSHESAIDNIIPDMIDLMGVYIQYRTKPVSYRITRATYINEICNSRTFRELSHADFWRIIDAFKDHSEIIIVD